ncbi:hypothetical protein HLI03_15590 [Rhizobium laguerreae]|uniref:hypothetical protein n=1 Tax=Rhizobium laguerreae TaxID=1076926 RepID=UPI001478E27E|nr:hypothetical protein [Rhizobium laguerreae]NNH43065.1 hypothetical protein [Rhizobium laguerreae]
MSVQNVRAALKKFLETPKEQVFCIRGEWGTGKTYTFDDVLKTMAEDGQIPLKNYAHVSLFGLNSLSEIKREIVQSTIPTDKIGAPFDPKNLESWYEGAKTWGKWAASKLSFLQQDAATAIIEVAAMMIRNQIILFDDLERKGDDLRSVDVLGYISQLRDERKNKVILILNDEQLEDKDEFESYLEKVVDIYLRFEPTREEIMAIAITETDEIALKVRDNALLLGIKNVRVIRKILRLAREVVPMLAVYTPLVTQRAIATVTLFGWSYLQPETAPPLKYLKKVSVYSSTNQESENNLKWRDLLLEYGFTEASNFDLQLSEGVENGYFEQAEIDVHAEDLHLADVRQTAQDELSAVWADMWNSFKAPVDDLLNRFFEVYVKNAENIGIGDMIHLEKLFRDLKDKRNEAIIDRYIEVNKNNPSAFETDDLGRFGEPITAEIIKKFEAAEDAQRPSLSSEEVLLTLAANPFDDEALYNAAALPVSEYLRVFETSEGQQLVDIMNGIKRYIRIINAGIPAEKVMNKAGVALQALEKQSEVNKLRARRHGLIQRIEQMAAVAEAEKKAAAVATVEG